MVAAAVTPVIVKILRPVVIFLLHYPAVERKVMREKLEQKIDFNLIC